ncbi:MAG: NAD(P)/FAD-dependent oxidoreductase [Psychroflexus sp.]|nr:NAD(P)/FAD-dependent oxidoreductase [Psychroflexus sp.]MDR9449315.1 NAD(P)/FAD-dependent oxidoreductase [Psychroflexus sp.]
MDTSDAHVAIIGAGVSGLVAAINLEKAGIATTVFEATDRVGGRVKTDYIDGLTLDHGFQVMLTAYPATQKYLDYSLLQLENFLPGAVLFENGKSELFGDPLRSPSFILPGIFGKQVPLSDKFKLLQLSNRLKRSSLDKIFTGDETSTIEYLKNEGFSDDVLQAFFYPFYSGIYLEDELRSSSKKFEFVYKMFSEGLAAIPKKGIQAIPNQLYAQLKSTDFHFNAPVDKIEDQQVVLKNGRSYGFEYVITATDASHLIPNLSNQQTEWRSVHNLYFSVKNKVIHKKLIGLVHRKENALINNLHYVQNIDSNSYLLSVSIIKDFDSSDKNMVDTVKKELKQIAGIEVIELVKKYHIRKALPEMQRINYALRKTETQLKESIFMTGDYLSNGSLNAAMLNGEAAGQAVSEKIRNGIIN